MWRQGGSSAYSRVVRRRFAFAVLPVAAVLAVPACGGDDDDGEKTYTLDEVCAETVPTICQRRESCCNASGVGFEQAGCEAREMASCQQNVDDVNAGVMEFDGSKVDACIDAFDALLADCRIPLPELLTRLEQVRVCSQVWKGQKGLGAACSRSAECTPSADPSTFTSCSDQGRCQRLTLVGSGAGCSLEGDDLRICEPGLYCDVQLAGVATCKPAVAVGQSCDPLAQDCGLGNYCEASSQSCVKARPVGEDCLLALQCESLSCTGGQCDPVEPVVDGADCTG